MDSDAAVKAAKAQEDKFVATLIANLESRRWLRALKGNIHACQQAIQIMETGKNGANDTLARVKELRDQTTPEAAVQLGEAKGMLQRFQCAIARRKQEERDAAKELHHGAREQRERDVRLHSVSEDLVIHVGSLLHDLPPDFFIQLDSCKDAATKTKVKEKGVTQLQKERQAAEREIDELVVPLALLRKQQASLASAVAPEAHESQLRNVRKPGKLLLLSRQREAANAELKQAILEQCEAEQRLYMIAEQSLTAKGILPPSPGGAEEELPEGETQLHPSANQQPKPGRSPATLDAETPNERRDEARRAAELTKRLKDILRNELALAREELRRMGDALDNLPIEAERRPVVEDMSPEAQEERGHAYFLEKSKRTRALIDAEAAFDSALQRAQDDGLEGVEAKTHGFSSHASDGYLISDVRAQISRMDYNAVERWMTTVEKAQAPGMGDGASEEEGGPSDGPVRVEASTADMQSLGFGESLSTVAVEKDRVNIDTLAREWRPDVDGFQPRRRGSV